MKTIILPGQSKKNKEWMIECQNYLIQHGIEAETLEWLHWDIEDEVDFATNEEIKRVVDLIGDDKVNILAKSVGTLVTTHLLQLLPNQINKVILCGIPIIGLRKQSLDRQYLDSLQNTSVTDITVFQNRLDPWGSYAEISSLLVETNPALMVIEKDREDHSYPFYEDFLEILST